nr:holo-ACP synthase [Ramlibacter aurantiacus]
MPATGRGLVRLGIDLAHIPRIRESLARFGDSFEHRLFTPEEIAYARAAPALHAERLAARFAAKEATIKALSLADAGVNWREMEVVREADGHCHMRLHGRVLDIARTAGVDRLLLSLTHDGDYAAAVVGVLSDKVEPAG